MAFLSLRHGQLAIINTFLKLLLLQRGLQHDVLFCRPCRGYQNQKFITFVYLALKIFNNGIIAGYYFILSFKFDHLYPTISFSLKFQLALVREIFRQVDFLHIENVT